jgi:hypothetical protein
MYYALRNNGLVDEPAVVEVHKAGERKGFVLSVAPLKIDVADFE